MASVEHIRAKIKELMTKHEKDKLHTIDSLMKQHRTVASKPLAECLDEKTCKENQLLKSLCEKYKEEHVPMRGIPIKEVYGVGARLGMGCSATVRQCKRKSDGKLFALKIISKNNLDLDDLRMLETEVNLMRGLSHPNVVHFHDVFFDSKPRLYIVMELVAGDRSLYERIQGVGSFPEKDASPMFTHLLAAMKYLHERKIVHRGIKPDDLLFESEAKDATMKLIDFGMAGSCLNKPLSTPCGIPQYVAPEVVKKEKYGTPSDMWACGVILYVILSGMPAFYSDNGNYADIYAKIKEGKYDFPPQQWDRVSDSAKDLVKKLMEVDPKKRLTAEQALAHPWIVGHGKVGGTSDTTRFQVIRPLRRGVRCILAVRNLIEVVKSDGKDVKDVKKGNAEDEKEEKGKGLDEISDAQKEYLEAFKLFDKDGDNVVTVDEICAVFQGLGFKEYSKEDVLKMAKVEDVDGNGTVDLSAFDVFDTDKTGEIDAEKLSAVMTALGEKVNEKDVQFMVKAIGNNENGKIDFKEFEKMMKLGPVSVTQKKEQEQPNDMQRGFNQNEQQPLLQGFPQQ